MIAVITGAGSGIGKATVLKLLERDYTVIAWVKDKTGELRLLEYLAFNNVRVNLLYILRADFLNVEEIENALTETKKILRKFKFTLNLFINSAGLYINTKNKSHEQLHINVNYAAPVKILLCFLPYLQKASGGRAIFLISSLKNGFSNYKIRHNFKTSFNYSKYRLANKIYNLAKEGSNVNYYLVIPKNTTSDFFIKNNKGLSRKLATARRLFSLPPEYTAQQLALIGTRPEFGLESGAIYKNLKYVSVPKSFSYKIIKEKQTALETATVPAS